MREPRCARRQIMFLAYRREKCLSVSSREASEPRWQRGCGKSRRGECEPFVGSLFKIMCAISTFYDFVFYKLQGSTRPLFGLQSAQKSCVFLCLEYTSKIIQCQQYSHKVYISFCSLESGDLAGKLGKNQIKII